MKHNEELTEKIANVLKEYPAVKLAYFFGSRAAGNFGPLSDYDLAIYIGQRDKKKNLYLKLDLLGKLTKVLKTESIDLVILDEAKNSGLKYNIIKEGKLIYDKGSYRAIVEPRILNEYFDFHQMLLKHNLTKGI